MGGLGVQRPEPARTSDSDSADPRPLILAFERVRDLPYAIDGGHDGDELLAMGRGDCLAKADLLARDLTSLGQEVRLVRFGYLLPDVVPQAARLPERSDLHRAVQVRRGDRWVLVDATHDPPLARGGLTVGKWDGINQTEPAYPPTGPVLVEGHDDTAIQESLRQIAAWVSRTDPAVMGSWRQAYIRWLKEVQERAV